MKNKTITTIILTLFLISFTSAITIYSGASVELDLEEQFSYYSIVGNSTEIDIEVTQDLSNKVTIVFGKYNLGDEFELIFFNSEKETITVYTGGGGGGGSSTKTIYKDNNIIEYVDRDVEVIKEVPGDTVEVEKRINKIPIFIWVLLVILVFTLLYLVFFKKTDTATRRLENNENEQKNNDASNDFVRN